MIHVRIGEHAVASHLMRICAKLWMIMITVVVSLHLHDYVMHEHMPIVHQKSRSGSHQAVFHACTVLRSLQHEGDEYSQRLQLIHGAPFRRHGSRQRIV
jgi:hypothetical protein